MTGLKLVFKRPRALTRVAAIERSTVTASTIATGTNVTQIINHQSFGTHQTASAPAAVGVGPSEYVFSGKPTPREIVEEIDKLPPYQRLNAGDNYKELRVSWPVEFRSINAREKNLHVLNTRFKIGNMPIGVLVCAEIKISDYPELKTMYEGTKLVIVGQIDGVDGWLITLRGAKISIPDRA